MSEPIAIGEYITDELEARGWGVADLVARTGLTEQHWEAIIAGDLPLMMTEAERLALATNTNAATWLGLKKRVEWRKP